MLNVSTLKCDQAAAIYSKFIKESYGITDCCGKYDQDEVEDNRLLISLYCSGFNIEELRNGPKEYKPKKSKRIKSKQKFVFTHIQESPSTTWSINHNLGYHPNVTIFDEDNEKITGTVSYLNGNSLQITFSTAQEGSAYLS